MELDESSLRGAHHHRLLRTSGVAAAANIGLLTIAVLDTIVTARLLGAGRKGSLFLLTTTVASISLILGCSLGPALQVAATQRRISIGTAARTCVALAGLSGLIAGAAAILLRDADVLRSLVLPGALLVPAELTVILLTPLFVAADRVGRRSIIEIGGAILDLGLTAGFIVSGGDRLFRAAIGIVLARWIFALVLVGDLWNRGSEPSEHGWRRTALVFGLRQHTGNILARAAKRADSFLLAAFLDAKAVGVYSIAATLSEIPLFVARAVQPSIVTFTAVLGRSSVREVARSARLVLAGYVVMLPVYGLLCAWLIAPVLGADFGEAVAPFLLLLVPTVCMAYYLILGGYFVGAGRPSLVTLIIGVPFVVNFALSLILIPQHGLVGNALASLIGGVAMSGLAIVIFRKETGERIVTVLRPLKGDLAVLIRTLRAAPVTAQETDAITP